MDAEEVTVDCNREKIWTVADPDSKLAMRPPAIADNTATDEIALLVQRQAETNAFAEMGNLQLVEYPAESRSA